MLLSDKSAFSVKEAYKTLRTNVMFSLPGKESKCIGVVSPDRGDGKSSVAINLAISFAQINKKSIIVDCDLRLPTIASKLQIESSPGLSNFLSGNQESEHPLIRRSGEYGIDIMTAGDIPPDPTALIGSKQMESFVALLKKYYDYIIIDFPPATIVSDAALLSNIVDGYLIVKFLVLFITVRKNTKSITVKANTVSTSITTTITKRASNFEMGNGQINV